MFRVSGAPKYNTVSGHILTVLGLKSPRKLDKKSFSAKTDFGTFIEYNIENGKILTYVDFTCKWDIIRLYNQSSSLKSKMVPQMTNYRKCQFVSFSFTECFYCYK